MISANHDLSCLREEFRTSLRKRKLESCVAIPFIVLFCCVMILYYVWDRDVVTFRNVFVNFSGKAIHDGDFVIRQPGCRIPSMIVNGPPVSGYIEKVDDLHCEYREVCSTNENCKSGWQPALVKSTDDSLFVDKSALKFYGLKKLNCTYQSFDRQEDDERTDDSIAYSNTQKSLDIREPTRVDGEFVEVLCTDGGKKTKRRTPPKIVYRDYFAFVPLKKDVENRCKNFEHERDRLNVMIVGLDALSRLNFHRQMPLSAAYLKHELKAVEMYGYNKVGDNTFPNLVPLLTGLDLLELRNSCRPNENKFFDDCPFVWKTFQEHGYRTIYAEDATFIATFNYLKNGFHAPPTDYYQRPFYVLADHKIGHKKPGNSYLCSGSRPYLQVLLDYALKHARTFRDRHYFGFFWSSSFTHDFFNLPSRGDEILLNFLRQLRDNDALLNRTALIVVSDHGLRWGNFRETYQGHLEERLPLLQFVLPDWFEREYGLATANMRRNARTLTTPFDLHETLRDFANTTSLRDARIIERVARLTYRRRQQLSLFLPISGARTCAAVGVPKHFCACHDETRQLSGSDSEVARAADVLIEHLNTLLAEHRECARLRLHGVERATVEASTMGGKFAFNGTGVGAVLYYMVTVKVRPGNAVFEATVKYERESRSFKVAGQVSRINRYGTQANCVNDSVLRLYCFCNDRVV